MNIFIFALSTSILPPTCETGAGSVFPRYTAAVSSYGSKHMEALGQRAQRKRTATGYGSRKAEKRDVEHGTIIDSDV